MLGFAGFGWGTSIVSSTSRPVGVATALRPPPWPPPGCPGGRGRGRARQDGTQQRQPGGREPVRCDDVSDPRMAADRSLRRPHGVTRVAGKKVKWSSEVTEFDQGKRVGIRSIDAPMDFQITWIYDSEGEGARVTFIQEVGSLGGFFGRLSDPLVVKMYSRDVRSNLDKPRCCSSTTSPHRQREQASAAVARAGQPGRHTPGFGLGAAMWNSEFPSRASLQ